MRPHDNNLDILRAMAVLCVLVDHCLLIFGIRAERLGAFGVLVFFVHTALVLMMSLERLAASDAPYFRRFYLQRLFRIYPLSVVCVLIVAACIAPPAGMVITNLLLVQNFSAHPMTNVVIAPLWSLPYEVQMYLLLPLVFWTIRRWPKLLTVAALTATAVVIPMVEQRLFMRPMASTVTQFFPCFMGGIVAYVLRAKTRPILAWALWPVAILAFGVAFHVDITYGGTLHIGLNARVMCLLLGASLPLFAETTARWLTRPAHLVAKYSYGIYLAHVPLLWLCLGRLWFLPGPVKWALFSVSIAAVPVLAYHTLEAPMVALGRRLSSPHPPTGLTELVCAPAPR
jgi:peptidoglycan/LPS O-acetylase OafA/YrhL